VPILVAQHRRDLFLIAHPTVDFWCLSICLSPLSRSCTWVAGQAGRRYPSARRTILCDDDRAFQLYRISVRFGLPVLPEWSEWFGEMLERKNAVDPLIGIGCTPVVVKGTKKRFLGWMGHALKRGAIKIPEHGQPAAWQVPISFSPGLQKTEDVAA